MDDESAATSEYGSMPSLYCRDDSSSDSFSDSASWTTDGDPTVAPLPSNSPDDGAAAAREARDDRRRAKRKRKRRRRRARERTLRQAAAVRSGGLDRDNESLTSSDSGSLLPPPLCT